MKATISVNMDNAAFEDHGELPRILRKLADKLEGDPPQLLYKYRIADSNGNRVGECEITEGSAAQ